MVTERAKEVLRREGFTEGPPGGPPMLPPPVQFPEYYPGAAQEFEELGTVLHESQVRLIEAERASAQAEQNLAIRTAPGLLTSIGRFIQDIFTGGLAGPPVATTEALEEQFELTKQRLDLALQEFHALEWRQEVMITMEQYLADPAYNIQSGADILNYVVSEVPLRNADVLWIEQFYERMKYLTNVLPEGFDGDAIEAQDKILDEILTAPKLELRAVHNLTVEEIAKSFAFGVADLPEGMTEEQVRSMLGEMGLMDEEMKSAKEWLDDRANAWAIESARLNLIRSGTVLAEAPELTTWEFTKLVATQPMMATVELLNKYFDMLPRPLYTRAAIGFWRMIGSPETAATARLSEQYEYYRSMGESSWSSYAMAFNEWDAPWWLKLLGEGVFDPTTYVGLGFGTYIGRKMGGLAFKAGVRNSAGSRIGSLFISAEQGFMSGMDDIFRAGLEAIQAPIKGGFWLTKGGYQIPRTFTQMSRNFARSSHMKLSAMMQRNFPKVRNTRGLTAKDAIDTASNAIDNAIARPTEGYDAAVRAGTPLLEFNYIDDIVGGKMLKGVADDIVFDTNRLAQFNNEVLNMFSGQGERVTAGKILAELGQEATEDAVTKMSTKLVAFRQKVADTAKAALKGDTADDVLMSVFRRLEKTRYDNLHSPLTKYMNQAGRSASWHSRVADRILYSSRLVALERRFVMPIARWNLLFSNFGPYNYAENSMRSFLGGAEPLYPKAYGGVAETNRLLRGLSNAPYELQLAARGEVRLTQAMVDPLTGRTAIFKGGNVPFITKNVTMPGWVPKWLGGGRPIGKTINIAGRDHYLASAQSGYDMWGFFNNTQVAYDYQTHFMKSLVDIDPDSMRLLSGAIEGSRAQIDNIASISARDARDIERVLLQDAISGGPDLVRTHQALDVLEFERRQISKGLGPTFDKATDVRMGTKTGIRDEVLDGSIFADIDGRMAAWAERERELSLVSLKNQIDVLTNEADAFLANPPRNLDEFLGDMQNISSLVEGTGERIHDYRRLTELRKAKLLPGEMDDFEVGSAKLLAEYMETSEVELTRVMNQLVDNARGLRAGGLVDWDAVRFTNVGEQYTPQIKKIIDDLPINIRFNIKTIRFDARLKLVDAKWSPRTKTITIKSPKDIDSIPHELGHSVSNDFIESGNYQVMDDFSRLTLPGEEVPSARADDILTIATERRISKYEAYYTRFKELEERFAASFDRWSVGEELGMSSEVVDFFRANFPKKVGLGLNDFQLARLTDLDSISRLELENILSTRNKVAGIEAAIPAFHKKVGPMWKNNPEKAAKLSKQFWDEQKLQKIPLWDLFDNNARKFKGLRLRASRNFLTSVDKPVFVPDFVPEVVTELTPNHLAYLYGSTGDDLYRGLTRVQHHITIRPREDFILHTVEQADAYAAKLGKTAANIGFTDDAIGDVYDQLWRNLGVEPSILTPDSPTIMQLEEIRQELTRLHAANKIPESDIVKWRQYINSVADDVGKQPMYRAELPTGVEFSLLRSGKPVGAGRAGTFYYLDRPRLVAGLKKEGVEVARSKRTFSNVFEITSRELDDAHGVASLSVLKKWRPDDSIVNRAVSTGHIEDLAYLDNLAAEEAVSRGYDAIKYGNRELQDLTGLAGVKPAATAGTADWWNTKERAAVKMKEMHALSYPTYDDANVIDESMRAIFPFWNYELFRWRWIPRTYMRTPGTMTGLARYMNYTDQGYLPVPATDLQMNILRGSVWMGGLRSFYLRDFPEYYDVMPGMEFIDYIGRAGFFPGIHVMLPIVTFGAWSEDKPEWGQLAPAWVRTTLSTLRALSPDHIGAVLEHIYPDRFRDYMTMLTLGEMGYDADLIWRKKQTDEELTPEEEKLWLQAVNKVDGVKGVLMQQTGLFRIRPQEFTDIRKEMRLAIEEATGVSVRVQEQIDRQYPVTGKRFSDYYNLDILQTKLLYEWETYRRWQGVTTPLYPSSWQLEDIRRTEYYQEVERIYEDARHLGVYEDDKLIRPSIVEINRQWVDGEIGPDQWMGARSDTVGSLSEAVRILGESPAYKDVPKTFEEMAERQEERGIPTMVQTPDQELLYYYYELRPDYKWSWEAQRMERDFDTYYAYIDILLESLDAPHRERLLQRIQIDWTPLERLYWQYSREFARPYRNLRDIVLREYEPEEIQQIRRYEVAPAAERKELQEIGPEGDKLISGYQRRLREARQRLRILDPTLDAWLNFFGTTTALLSTEAKEIYEDLRAKYLVKEMIQ